MIYCLAIYVLSFDRDTFVQKSSALKKVKVLATHLIYENKRLHLFIFTVQWISFFAHYYALLIYEYINPVLINVVIESKSSFLNFAYKFRLSVLILAMYCYGHLNLHLQLIYVLLFIYCSCVS